MLVWIFTGFDPDYPHTTCSADEINHVKMAKILELAYLTAWKIGDATVGSRFPVNSGSSGDAVRRGIR